MYMYFYSHYSQSVDAVLTISMCFAGGWNIHGYTADSQHQPGVHATVLSGKPETCQGEGVAVLCSVGGGRGNVRVL